MAGESEAGSQHSSAGSKTSAGRRPAAPPEIDEEEVDEKGVELVVEGPENEVDPHEDSEEELLQQKADPTTDDEEEMLAALDAAATAQEETTARSSKRASWHGLHWQSTIASPTRPPSRESKKKDHKTKITFENDQAPRNTFKTPRSEAGGDPAQLTARSKTLSCMEEGEQEESEDLCFTYIACGAAHTLLVTDQGRMLLACGNHRYGQLGIAEKVEKKEVLICDVCLTLQALWECKSCTPTETHINEERKWRYCDSCWNKEHKKKINRLHQQERIKKPENKKCRVEPCTVKTNECEQEGESDTVMGSSTQIGFGLGEEEVEEDENRSNWPVVDLYNAMSVACGDAHTLAIVSNGAEIGGEVYSWGSGSSARTGLFTIGKTQGGERVIDPDVTDQFLANLIEIPAEIGPAEDASDTSSRAEIEFRPLEAIQVAAGGQHSLALQHVEETKMGCVFSWGNNEYGQLGRLVGLTSETDYGRYTHQLSPEVEFINADTYRITTVACGDLHCLALARYGIQLYSWGCGANGRLGYDCDGVYQVQPRSVGPPCQDPYVAIAGGTAHSAAITRDKELYCWGKNDAGQCGHFSWGDSGPLTVKDVAKILGDPEKKLKTPMPADVMEPYCVFQSSDHGSRRLPAVASSRRDQSVHSVESTGLDRGMMQELSPLQVACGENHTLALIDDTLWLLGSGLDQRFRRDNMKIEKAPNKKRKDKIVFSEGFTPRKIEIAFTDTAEISTKPPTIGKGIPNLEKEDNDPGDAVRYTLRSLERFDDKDPTKPPEIEDHHCLTFTFSGDLDGLVPGCVIAFTGPTAPIGLRLESVKDGPWFKVLGEKETFIECARADDDAPPLTWDSSDMRPDHKPFYEYKIVVNELREATDVEKDPARDGNESFGGPFKPLQDRIEIMQGMKKDEARTTYMYISRLEEAENADGSAVKPGETVDPKAPRVAYVLASTLNNECLPKGSLIRGSRSGAKCEVLSTEWELLTDPLENPVIKWIKSFGTTSGDTKGEGDATGMEEDANEDWHTKNRVTVEVSEDVLTGKTPTYESVAAWLTDNVKDNNLQNLLVCLKAEIPPLKQIDTGAFHAAALTQQGQVLIWGKGSLGRLGLGNELDQLVPTIIEMELGQIEVIFDQEQDQGLRVVGPKKMKTWEDENGQKHDELVFAGRGDKNDEGDTFTLDDRILDIQHVDVTHSDDDSLAYSLLAGPIGSKARVTVRRMVPDEFDPEGPYVSREVTLHITRINLGDLEDEVDEEEEEG